MTFASGETSKTVSVSTIDDTAVEGTETFYVNLSGASGGATIGQSQGVGTINDNDTAPPPTPPSFSVSNAASVNEGCTVFYTVTRSGSTTGTYSVSFATANGSAAAGSDYNANSGTLTFASGETSKTISVSTIDDSAYEGDETVLVNLSSPSGGATIGTAQGTGTILANDLHPPVTVNDTKQVGRCTFYQGINLTANDSDPDGYLPLTLTAITGPYPQNINISSASTVDFDSTMPAGTYTYTYTVQDTRGASAQANGTFTVNVIGSGVCP